MSLRAFVLSFLAVLTALLAAAPVRAHEDHAGHEAHAEAVTAARAAPAPVPAAAAAAASAQEPLADEPVIPGVDWSTDFQIAPDGDVYVGGHDGEIRRYERVGGTTAHPRYELEGTRIWKFSVTKEFDRGLIGIALDSAFGSGQRYLYALLTRGSTEYVRNVPDNKAGIRRTAHLVRIAIPQTGVPQASDLKVILGADAPANPDASCKPYMRGAAAAVGETDALPNGVDFIPEDPKYDEGDADKDTILPDFSESHIYPDGNLASRADGAYDCIPTDGDTHGPGTVASAPDGSLFVSIGDATLYSPPQNAALRTQNLESYAGKVLHIDRTGKGVANHPFCAGEADLTRVCTKVWAIGLRNAFRVQLLAPDGASGGQPALAVGDVGNYSMERLTIAHPGDNLGWPCWEGSYYNYDYAGPGAGGALKTGWGGPSLVPIGVGRTSCEHKTATGDGSNFPSPSPDITWPTLEYQHEQDPVTTPAEAEASGANNGAAIVAGGTIVAKSGADPAVALPAAWTGSLVFGDYARGWINRLSVDASDPTNTDHDAGLRVPEDEGRARPTVQTDYATGRIPDPLLERIAEPPTVVPPAKIPPYFRLTMRQGPDGALWYVRYGGRSQSGGLYRFRTAPAAAAQIESVSGSCATGSQTQGPITLTARDAGTGATYAWDVNGDGVADAGRTARSTTLTATQLAALAGGTNWVRVFVSSGTSRSVATRYVCAGKTPDVSISAPADGTEVVLGETTVVSATRPAGDAAATGVPDALLQWKAETVHGSNHTHLLADTTNPFETVGGVQKMQLTVRPDTSHELGTYTQVRIYAPQADGNSVAQSIRLVPKPVPVTLSSSPAGAPLTMLRDGPSTVVTAPGSFQAAAGFSTSISAPDRFTSGGKTYWFQRWSDGALSLGRPWRVPASGGTAPIAEYAVGVPPTTPPTSPVDTTPTTPPATTPPTVTTPLPSTPGDPSPTSPAEPTPGTPNPAPRTPLIPPPTPLILRPTSLELATAPLTVAGVRDDASKVTGMKATLDLGRNVDATGLVVKVALRDASCRWWRFGSKRFAGRVATGARRSTRRICVQPPTWKAVSSAWAGERAVATVRLARALPPGRYALRLRVMQGGAKLTERVRAVVVK